MNVTRIALLGTVLLWSAVSEARGAEVQLNGYTFQLPDGFTIELVAKPPLVLYPICADFDEQGGLYVGESSGTRDSFEIQSEKKPHRILRLEDSDGDGRFDKRTVFADGMMVPHGSMWFDGSLYVGAPPNIWKLTDTDGDGVADQRVEWLRGKQIGTCGNGLRGPYLGPDGMIYWSKALSGTESYERPGLPPLITSADHIFRRRPDGGGLEYVMTGSTGNLTEVAFTRGGERFINSIQVQQLGAPRVSGIFHVLYGGVYPVNPALVRAHARTGPTRLPVLTDWGGAAAPAGLARYESQLFGSEFQNNLFAALFNYHKVTRHVLQPNGATFKTHDEDFLACENIEFHPTDVLEDADGSLLVIETGGWYWYRHCCPTSRFYKPQVAGAIYRIRRAGAPAVDDPRGLKLDWKGISPAKLTGLLGDDRPAVRRRAIHELAKRGEDSLAVLRGMIGPGRQIGAGVALPDRPMIEGSVTARRGAVWAATRIDGANARAVVRAALGDADELVCQAALHSVSLWRDRAALPRLLATLKSASPHNRRAAAEALGRIGNSAAVPALLAALARPADRILEHSLIFALIEIADRDATAAGLKNKNVRIRRAAMTVLDQMPNGNLAPRVVAAELDSSDPKLRETAWWIAGRHPQWGEALSGALRRQVVAKEQSRAERDIIVSRLARFARTPALRTWLVERLSAADSSRESKRIVLRTIAQSNGKNIPEEWIAALAGVLGGEDAELFAEAITTVHALQINPQESEALKDELAQLRNALLSLTRNADLRRELRLQAAAVVPGGLDEVDPALFQLMLSGLDDEAPPARSAVVEALARSRLSAVQFLRLTDAFGSVGPMEISRLLEPFKGTKDDRVGRQLVAALRTAPAAASLRVEQVRPIVSQFGPQVQKQAEPLYTALTPTTAEQAARLEELLSHVSSGDPQRGQRIFSDKKFACASCHRMVFDGGDIGPALTRIGQTRNERDLLESIVIPSATIVQRYEPWTVVTTDGRTLSGVIQRETPDAIVLTAAADKSFRIDRSDIENMAPSPVSIMPQGLDRQLTPQQLADLVAFLKSCR